MGPLGPLSRKSFGLNRSVTREGGCTADQSRCHGHSLSDRSIMDKICKCGKESETGVVRLTF